jgi:hypothetical protein
VPRPSMIGDPRLRLQNAGHGNCLEWKLKHRKNGGQAVGEFLATNYLRGGLGSDTIRCSFFKNLLTIVLVTNAGLFS